MCIEILFLPQAKQNSLLMHIAAELWTTELLFNKIVG